MLLISICRRGWLVAGIVGLTLGVSDLTGQTRGLLREVYDDIGGSRVVDLTAHDSFPNRPTSESIIENFEAPTNVDEDYGQRVRGFVIPPETGNYTFWIASDDGGALFLSTDESPANIRQIAAVPGWTASRVWTKYPEQRSDPISLQSGQRYYVEALMKERGGGDNLAVRWRMPNGEIEAPIPNVRLRPITLGPPEIVSQPKDVSVTEDGAAVFVVELSRNLGASFQWQRNGADIPGATSEMFELEKLTLADNGARFRVVVRNDEGVVTSQAAQLTVRADSAGPALLTAQSLGDPGSLTLTFSEPVEVASATRVENYSINRGIVVSSARVAGGGETVVLGITPVVVGETYEISVQNVRDRATFPNTIASGTSRSFTLELTPLPMTVLSGEPEPEGPSARTTGIAITEIHYHPRERADQRNLEFIELYNSQAWEEDLSGYRLTGDVSFEFPAGTVLDRDSYLVVAVVPDDVKRQYALSTVLGPLEGSIPNGGGRIRLRNPAGAILLEMTYRDREGWPVAADGWGHSLVLARPSYGQADSRAWFQSARLDGSPGGMDPQPDASYSGILFNELLAHTDDPIVDYVELYNYSDRAVDLTGCGLSDQAGESRYVFPAGSSIPSQGYLSLDQNELGFALSSGGETLVLRAPDDGVVIDIVRYTGQANGVSFGRSPDGAALWHSLAERTPGAPNVRPQPSRVVINELMYHPISRDAADEYLELYNVTRAAMDLSGWRVTGEIEFQLPEGTMLMPGGYLVLAKDAARLVANYSALSPQNVLGDFRGTLSNNGGRVALERPDTIAVLDPETGGMREELIWIVEDEVTYADGGRWGQWSDGGGSSLELIDAHSENRLASNWGDSDETAKSEWTTIEHTGRLDNGNGDHNELQVLLLGGGECLVDDLFVSQAGGENLVPNPSFDGGLDEWVIQGNHVRSGLSERGAGFQSPHGLHLRATSAGDNGANRVESDLTSAVSNGRRATLRAQVRWLRGHPEILLRIHGNMIELSGRMPVPTNLGSPGEANSIAQSNVGPAIYSVQHDPVLPRSRQDVEVTAHVHDPDGLASLVLKYRLDREEEYETIPMTYRGAGAYSAMIPGQANRSMIAFFVEAADGHEQSSVTQFPANPLNRECLVRFGESAVNSEFGTYRVWIANENLNTWRRRENLSNELIDTTFVYGNFRAIYNTRSRFRGSPFIRPNYGNPASSQPTAMIMVFPEDDLFLGVNKVNMDGLEQPGRDNTLQRERTSFWIAKQMGLPYSHQRYVQFVVNGIQKGEVFTDSQHPSSEYVETWFPNESEGDLYKIDDWFEFNDSVRRQFHENAMLRRYTSEGSLKVARYRWSWEKKPNQGYVDDYSSLLELVEALNSRDTVYEQEVEAVVDVEQWMRIFAVRHIVGDWDGYGYTRGKNMSTFKPDGGKWKMILWDLDFSLGGGSRGTSDSMFTTTDATIRRMYEHPSFRRAYLRAWQDAVDGPLLADRSTAEMEAVYRAFQRNSVSAANPSGNSNNSPRNWIRGRRTYLVRQLERENSAFEITTGPGGALTSSDNVVSLRGKAPIAVKTIRVNGVEYPISWTSVSDWLLQVPLAERENILQVAGYDLRGNLVAGSEGTVTVRFTGTAQDPADHLVINEIMYNPATPGTGFIELFNTSSTHSFDLSNYGLNGVDFTFDPGYVLGPESYAVVVSDRTAFAEAYGGLSEVAGEFAGRLANDGETVSLVDLSGTDGSRRVIDEVTYSDQIPWPSLADGNGSSLQLVNPELDNRRVASWSSVAPSGVVQGPQTLVSMTSRWSYDQSGRNLGTRWRAPDFDDSDWEQGRGLLFVETSDLPAAKSTALTLGRPTYYFRQRFNVEDTSGLELDLSLIVDDGAVVYLNGTEIYRLRMRNGSITYNTFAEQPAVTNAQLEGPFSIPGSALVPGENVIAVEVHQVNATSSDVVFGLSLVGEARGGVAATPGAKNSNGQSGVALPTLWLNEISPLNQLVVRDGAGDGDPWVELFNSGTTSLSLEGMSLSPDFEDLKRWTFPDGASIGPGEYRLVWCDGETAEHRADEWHTNFRVEDEAGSIYLTATTDAGEQIVDYLNYDSQRPDRSYGTWPNGLPNRRRPLFIPTPGAANELSVPQVNVTINEWMADNASDLVNPVSGEFDDWFELYNGGNSPVDLSGYFLSDDPADLEAYRIPLGTVIAPRSFLLVWAGGQASDTLTAGSLQAGFRLSRGGEVLTLSGPGGVLIDQVTFLQQSTDVSQGRLPDGNLNRIGSLPSSSPGASNLAAPGPNLPPFVLPIPNRVIDEGERFELTVGAFDPDGDVSLLRFELGEGAPEGVTIDSVTGVIRWVSAEEHGPGDFLIPVVVTDGGNPAMSGTNQFGVRVNEVNQAPLLAEIDSLVVSAGATLTFTVPATDVDIPLQDLSFALTADAPEGMAIDGRSGIVTWNVPPETEPGSYGFTVGVSDSGVPVLSTTQRYEVIVTEAVVELQLVLVATELGEIAFEWQTMAGRRYVIQAVDSVESDQWQAIAEIVGDGDVVRLREATEEGRQRFYRVVVE